MVSSSLATTLGKVLALGSPLLLGQLMRYLHQVTDSAMLGNFGSGSAELAAMGIAGLFTWILNTFLWPISNGVQAISSRRFGRSEASDPESLVHVGESLDNGLVVGLISAALAFGLSLLAGPILGLLIGDLEIRALALEYVAVVRWGLVPTSALFVIQGFFSAINRTRYVMYAGLISNGLNIALNYIFIFGGLGLEPMGITGAALGTVLSYLAASAFLLLVALRGGYHRQYRLFHFSTLGRKTMGAIARQSLPPGIQNVVALSIILVYQSILEDYSGILLAATHGAFAYFRINKTLIGGFARGAAIGAGNALGRGDKAEAQRAAVASGIVAVAISLVLAIFTVLLRPWIADLFTNDPATAQLLSRALLFFVPFFFIEALGYAFEMVFISNGYGPYVLASELGNNLIFILGGTLLLRHFFPDQPQLAWLGFASYQVVHALVMVVGFIRRRWMEPKLE